MTYKLEMLRLGTDSERIPEAPDMLLNNTVVPVQRVHAVFNPKQLWNLVFTYADGTFYRPGEPVHAPHPQPMVQPFDDAPIQRRPIIQLHRTPTVEAWYVLDGPDNNPTLMVAPFIKDEDGTGMFAQTSSFLDSTPPNVNGVISTKDHSATARVHATLPEYNSFKVTPSGGSREFCITTETISTAFEQLWIPAGGIVPAGDTITVPQDTSCYALAIFRRTKHVSVSCHPIPSTKPYLFDQELLARIINDVVANEKGELYERMDVRTLASLNRETALRALSALSSRVEHVQKLKDVVSGLVHQT